MKKHSSKKKCIKSFSRLKKKEKEEKSKENEHDGGKLIKEDFDYLQYWLMVLVNFFFKPTN